MESCVALGVRCLRGVIIAFGAHGEASAQLLETNPAYHERGRTGYGLLPQTESHP